MIFMSMKKILLFAFASLLIAGCKLERIEPEDGNNKDNDNDKKTEELILSFTASHEILDTKAVMGKNATINWQSTDQLSLFDGAGANCVFSTKGLSVEATSCTFEGEVTELAADYTAVYPYTETASLSDDGVISGITLPATQTAVEGSFDPKAALMAAKTVEGGKDLTFQNIVGYVQVSTDSKCKKIELFAGNGEILAGAGSISFDAKNTPSFTLSPEGALSTITLAPEGEGLLEAGKSYYIAVPAVTLEAGWGISITGTNDKVYKRIESEQIQFKKNTVINLGTIKQEAPIPYVTFSAESEQTFTMSFQLFDNATPFTLGEGEYFQYRVGDGEWQSFTNTISDIVFGGNGNDLQLRGISSKGTALSISDQLASIRFGFDDVPVSCSGDIRTLVDYRNYETANTSEAMFCNLFFECVQLTSAPDLPATELAATCYFQMFSNCIALTKAPALPATTLTEACYKGMFEYCIALTEAPALPATTLADYCYLGMFAFCIALTEAPALPATTLALYCYSNMFNTCESLTEAPELPAATLAPYCYSAMFIYCKSLTEAPALPATTLAPFCYSYMFSECYELTKVPVLPDAQLAFKCYEAMFVACKKLSEVWIALKPSFTTEDEDELRTIKEGYANCFDNWLNLCSNTGTLFCTEALYNLVNEYIIPSGWSYEDIEKHL